MTATIERPVSKRKRITAADFKAVIPTTKSGTPKKKFTWDEKMRMLAPMFSPKKTYRLLLALKTLLAPKCHTQWIYRRVTDPVRKWRTVEGHRTTEGCGAKDVPAEALEKAVIKRLSEIASADGERERIRDEAIRLVEADAVRIDSEKATAQHRLSEVSSQIGKLMALLRDPGFAALESVKLDLQQLESEQTRLRERIATLDAEGGPLNEVITAAKAFLTNWSGLDAILEEATTEGLRNVLPHFVEVVEIRASDEDGKRGEYTLGFLPGPDAAESLENAGNNGSGVNRITAVSRGERKAPRAQHSSNFQRSPRARHFPCSPRQST